MSHRLPSDRRRHGVHVNSHVFWPDPLPEGCTPITPPWLFARAVYCGDLWVMTSAREYPDAIWLHVQVSAEPDGHVSDEQLAAILSLLRGVGAFMEVDHPEVKRPGYRMCIARALDRRAATVPAAPIPEPGESGWAVPVATGNAEDGRSKAP